MTTTLDPALLVPEGKTDTRTKEGKLYKKALATKACELKEEGWPITAIAEALKVSPSTASAYVSFPFYGGGGHLGLAVQRPTYRATEDAAPRLAELREAAQDERERERQENIAWARAAYRRGDSPWRGDRTYDELPLGPDEQRALEGLVEEQARQLDREEAGWGERPRGSQSVWPRSLDKPLRAPDGYTAEWLTTQFFLRDHRESDPFVLLTGTTEQHMQEVLGDLDLEDVARLSDHELELLRERIREAGLAPSSVQRRERERLSTPDRHRGYGSAGGGHAKMRGRAKTRTRKERSARHKQTGKRYNRRKENYRTKDAA